MPKTGQKTPLPREDAPEAPLGRVAVQKSGQKNTLSREDATETPVGRVTVPKTGQKTPSQRDNLYPMVPLHERGQEGPQDTSSAIAGGVDCVKGPE